MAQDAKTPETEEAVAVQVENYRGVGKYGPGDIFWATKQEAEHLVRDGVCRIVPKSGPIPPLNPTPPPLAENKAAQAARPDAVKPTDHREKETLADRQREAAEAEAKRKKRKGLA